MSLIKELKEEYELYKDRDPALRSYWDVLLYPCHHALKAYRKAHKLWLQGKCFRARLISQKAARKTGIEIHPGATIGKGLFIDHGAGVVIGETTVIGDNCTLYQGVTLGGTGKEHGKRHPTLKDGVMYQIDMTGPICLIVGSEGEGVSRLVKENCDYVAKVPMKGEIESLNASVAAGVLMYETVRQRLQK